tara:strand:+ start:101 stop:436 length:336 start_codon:yes stop_codon:yes gene_type:complete
MVEKENKQTVGKEEEPVVPIVVEDRFDAYEVIKFPLSTEKAIRQIEFDNKITFVVHSRATKVDVKRAVEELFKVKVVKINIQNSFNGQKKAYVKLSSAYLASDISGDLGLI